MKVIAVVNDNNYEGEVDRTGKDVDTLEVMINGKKRSVRLVEIKESSLTISIGDKVFFFELKKDEGKVTGIITGARTFSVEVKTPMQQGMEDLLNKYKKEDILGSARKEIRAPMPGRIVSVRIKEGDLVRLGQQICVLEAMKMENEISATAEGKVKKVSIRVGDMVPLHHVLVTFED